MALQPFNVNDTLVGSTPAGVVTLQEGDRITNEVPYYRFAADPTQVYRNSLFRATDTAVPPATSPLDMTVPKGVGTPDLSTPEATDTHETLLNSQTDSVAASRKALEDAYNKQVADIEAKTAETQKNIDRLTKNEETIIQGPVEQALKPFQANLEKFGRTKYKIDQNFEANQKLVDELDSLLTEGNATIKKLSEEKVPGLAGIQQSPHLINTLNNVQARVGVINAVMAARNSQINVAEGFIDRSVNAINSDRKDQLSYYKTLLDFYDKQRDEEGNKLIDLSKQDQKFIDAKISLLENDLNRSQETADAVKKLMTDPDTALLVAKAGISLNDSPEEINKKMAQQIQNDNNLSALQAANFNNKYADVNGEIQNATTGYAYTSPEDFKERTGMTLEQAGQAGLISKPEFLPEATTANQKDYNFYAAQERAAGREPMDFNQFIHQKGSGSSGSVHVGDYVFTQTQLNKGIDNAGISRAEFTALDPEIQNFFISSTAADLSDIDTGLANVADGSVTVDEFMNAVSGMNLSPVVEDFLKGLAEQNAPTADEGGGGGGGFWSNLWNGITGWLKDQTNKSESEG